MSIMQDTIVQLNNYPPDKYNVLIPVTSMQVMSNMQRIIVNEVRLDTKQDGKDIYYDRQTGKYAITAVGGTKLAAAANISIVYNQGEQPEVCKRCIQMAKATGNVQVCGTCPHTYDVKHTVTVRVPEPSGGFRLITKSKEIDCQLEKESMKEAQYKRFLPHRGSMAETKAYMRCLRAALGLAQGYTMQELQKTFIIAHIVPNLDAPEVRKALISNSLRDMGLLFEMPGNQPQLPQQDAPTELMEGGIKDGYSEEEYSDNDNEPLPWDAVSEQQEPLIIHCVDCGSELIETTDRNGQKWTAEMIREFSTNRFGRCLCTNCQKKVKGGTKVMMKILHCADLHLGDLSGPVRDGKNARREDTLRCMRAIVESAAKEKPNVAIIAGDLFNRPKVWADTALEDIEDAINNFLRPICRASEQVVLLFGTMNHDNPRAFSVLAQIRQGERNFHIYTGPTTETLNTSAGAIQILAMPGFDKGRLRAFIPDMDAETENQNATTLVNEIIMGQAAKLEKDKPSVRVAHYTVAGCEADNGQTFLAGQDVVILPQTIDATGVTLGCFGHIHKPQRIGCNTPAYYCGSPNQLTFNDENNRHGFYIHEISTGEVKSRFLFTPERRYLTVRLTQDQVAKFIADGTVDEISQQAQGAILRVYYDATPEQEKALNRAALQSWLMDKGAFHVADFIWENTEDVLIQDGAAADDTPMMALHRYLGTMKDGGADLTDERYWAHRGTCCTDYPGSG